MNKEENILFQYQVKSKTTMGIRYYYFYAKTDIENYLNDKNIKYVRYAKDTALNKKEKRIRELFKENQHLKEELKIKQEIIEEVRDVIEKMIDVGYVDGMTCYYSTKNDSEFGVRAKILLQILDKGESNE